MSTSRGAVAAAPARVGIILGLTAALLGAAPAASARTTAAGTSTVRVAADAEGSRLEVDGEPFMVFGMNWDYFPIGTNYAYDFWGQPDAFIEAALAREMSLLRDMGVNAIRVYTGIPPRWIRHIYERYGIYTVLNHTVARYGYTLDGVWIPHVDYSDPRLREALRAEIAQLVEAFKDTPGLLMWLLGNENNYGLSWTSFEIEALPASERDAARARHLYSLFNDLTREIKSRDRAHPVAIANGDLQYIDVIAEECTDLDVFGTNVYRGISARDLFQVVRDKLGKPVMFTEFGADAYNAREMREDQITQARYHIGQWREIYEQSSGKGRVGNAIGGLIFQWTDGWWKFRQEERLDIHDTNASWPNAGYPEDYVEGENNMNEEWWGICAKGPTNSVGLYEIYPRAAYYALRDAFELDPYAPGTDLATIRRHFDRLSPAGAMLEARGDAAALQTELLRRVRVSNLRIELETYSTGGKRVSTPEEETSTASGFPAFQGFDSMQSMFVGIAAQPSDHVTGTLSLSILGNVPTNPIDEIFYENRGRTLSLGALDPALPDAELTDVERVKIYSATAEWDERLFTLNAFYRAGHLHWGYEGDFFGLYRDAYYGENIDIYNGEAPRGFEIRGKRALAPFTLAMGSELWWGANPAIFLKYDRTIGPFETTTIYQEDLDDRSGAATSSAVPLPPVRKGTFQFGTARGPFTFEAGGIWSGNTKVGETFQIAERTESGYRLLIDEVRDSDTFGAKAKVTVQRGRWNWYAQAAYMGLVADAGPTAIPTFTGWHLKDSGLGNQSNVLSGIAVNLGRFQVAPNVLYQKPLVGPIPSDVPSPGRPRNVLDDPFAVRENREMVGYELLLSYDPTPATWMWQWDNEVREEASFAASLGFIVRDFKTTRDAAIGVESDGSTTFAFPGAPPARTLWESHARIVSRLSPDARLVATAYVGEAEPNGDDPRLIERGGVAARLAVGQTVFETFVKLDDWGPYDYHRDFNLTFPVQLMGDVSRTVGTPRWFGLPQTRVGVRGTWRSLDENSPRYCPARVPDGTGTLTCDPEAPGPNGYEWEIRTYVHLSM